VLRHAGGNRTWAARALGISRQALVAKISRLGLAVL
jgi:DNA-binding protein Fis